jgi:pantoate kinase
MITGPLADITEEALEVLYQKLGAVDTARFLTQYTVGHRNCTELHETLFADVSLEELVDEIKRDGSSASKGR